VTIFAFVHVARCNSSINQIKQLIAQVFGGVLESFGIRDRNPYLSPCRLEGQASHRASASVRRGSCEGVEVLFFDPSSIGSCSFLLLVVCLLGVSLVSCLVCVSFISSSLWFEQFGAWSISLWLRERKRD